MNAQLRYPARLLANIASVDPSMINHLRNKWWCGPPLPRYQELLSFMDDNDSVTRACDAKFNSMGERDAFEREILVALQPISECRPEWEAIAAQVRAAPATWRWWIRRHPVVTRPTVSQIIETMNESGEIPIYYPQYTEDEALTSLRMPNVLIREASLLPTPALLRHMDVVVSLFSKTSMEAAAFGVPAFFVCEVARLLFGNGATVIDIPELNTEIARLPKGKSPKP
jgi:hypothetical protein